MMRKRMTNGCNLLAAAFIAAAVTAPSFAGAAGERQALPAAKVAAPPASQPARVEVVDFRIDPVQPREGDRVTARLTARNFGPGTAAKIAWKIVSANGNRILAQGEQQNVPANGTVTGSAAWNAVPGPQQLKGMVELPGSVASTAATAQRNTERSLALNIAAKPAAVPAAAKGVSTSTAAAPATSAATPVRAATGKPVSADARIDPGKLKQDLRDQATNTKLTDGVGGKGPFSGLEQGTHGGRRGQPGAKEDPKGTALDGRPGSRRGEGPGSAVWVDQGKTPAGGPASRLQEAVGTPTVTGQRYGDSFAGGNINSRNSGGTRNYRGSGKGSAMEGDEESKKDADGNYTSGMSGEEGGLDDGTLTEMMRSEGVTPSGNKQQDMQELSYAQSVGPDMYRATKDMSKEERRTYLNTQANKQKWGQRPREDKDSGGAWKPVTQQELHRQSRAISAKSGADDGKVEQNGGGGPMRTFGQDDRPDRERAGGKLNMDKVMEINQVVNPGSR